MLRRFSTFRSTPTLGTFTLPAIENEPMVRIHHLIFKLNYAPGSTERSSLKKALKAMQNTMPYQVPIQVSGQKVSSSIG